MDAAYLREHVGDALAEGLSATIVAQPDDSVAYLGRFLLKYVDRKEAEEKMKEREAVLAREEEEAKQEEGDASDEGAPERERQRQEEEQAQELEQLLETAKEVDDSIWGRLLERVRLGTGAVGVYVAKKEARAAGSGDAGEAEEGEEDAPTSQIRYIAATEDHAFMRTMFLDSNQGVTFGAWQEPPKPEGEGEEEEEEADEEAEEEGGEGGGAAAKKEPPPLPELPVVQVDNVLLNPRVHFFRLPKLGAYVAVPLRYRSSLHPAAIPESEFAPPEPPKEGEEGEGDEEGDEEEKGDGDEDEEGADGDGAAQQEKPLPTPVVQDVDLAICFDTMGKDHRLTSERVEFAKRWVDRMRSALERTEQGLFEEEVRVVRQLPEAETSAKESMEAVGEEQEAITEEVQQAVEAKLGEIREARLARAKEIAAAKKRAKAAARQSQQGESGGGGGAEGDEEKEEGEEDEGEGGQQAEEEEEEKEEPVEEPEVEESSVPDVGALERGKGAMRKAGKELEAAQPVRELLSRRKIPPSDEQVKVMHTAFRLRGISAEELGDAYVRDPLAPAWQSIRSYLAADDFVDRFSAFDPANVEDISSCLAPAQARSALEGLIPAQGEEEGETEGTEGDGSRSIVTTALLRWSRGAIEALEAWEQKQTREKQETEAHEAALKAAEEGDQAGGQGEGEEEEEDE